MRLIILYKQPRLDKKVIIQHMSIAAIYNGIYNSENEWPGKFKKGKILQPRTLDWVPIQVYTTRYLGENIRLRLIQNYIFLPKSSY